MKCLNALIIQQVEYDTFNIGVTRSSRVGGTNACPMG